jgi:hypothetical protein
MKNIAICMRGKCLDTNLNCKTNKIEHIDYKLCINSIKNHIININTNCNFDFYLHGWINNINDIPDIINNYKPKIYILELQKDFKQYYININNYSVILQERYKHLHKNNSISQYTNINYQHYFENIFSYCYSISKSIELISDNINYDLIISLRYDCLIQSDININILNPNLYYTDNIGRCHSYLFYGDFIAISNKTHMLQLQHLFNFLQTNIYNNVEYIRWTNQMKRNKHLISNGKFNHGIYSNQMIYAYFLYKNNILFNTIQSCIDCKLIKS